MCIFLQRQKEINNITYKNMNTMNFIETLSQEEMQTVKGGIWIYDETTGEWVWIKDRSFDPDEDE